MPNWQLRAEDEDRFPPPVFNSWHHVPASSGRLTVPVLGGVRRVPLWREALRVVGVFDLLRWLRSVTR